MKESYYFKHDSNARNDPKMLLLRARHGAEGYALFFMLIEIFREQEGFKLLVEDVMYEVIALSTGFRVEKVKKIIASCIQYGLLVSDTHLYSDSLLERMEKYEILREIRESAGRKPKQNGSKTEAKPEQNGSKTEANDQAKEEQKNPLDILEIEDVLDKEYPDAFFLCKKLVALLKQNDPRSKEPKKLVDWVKEADKLMRLDERPKDEIIKVLHWCQSSSFWKANILSMPKFREKYQTLKLQMENDNGTNKQGSGRIVGGAEPVPGKYEHLTK